jgi:hypothetical protein
LSLDQNRKRNTHMDFVISRRQQEFYGMPVGDPFRGAAYGERNMPAGLFAAIGGAFATLGTAATAGMAAAGGFAAVAGAGLTALGTIATVAGIGMSIVGMATGDSSLTKLGGIVGLAGGVGMLGGMGLSGLAASSAASSAAPAANMTMDGFAAGGSGGLGGMSSASSTITPAFSSATGQAMAGSTQLAQAGTAGLSSAANGMLSPASMGMTNLAGEGVSSAITQGALNSSSSLISATNNALSALGSTVAKSGGFFSDVMSTKDVLSLGATALGGISNMGNNTGKVNAATAAYYNAKTLSVPQENELASRKLDADIAASDAELKQKQQVIDADLVERQRKIDNWNSPINVSTPRVVYR